MGGCSVVSCDGDTGLPYDCRRCSGTYCSEHRLPENHNCPGLPQQSESLGKPLEVGIEAQNQQRVVTGSPSWASDAEDSRSWGIVLLVVCVLATVGAAYLIFIH